MLKNFCQAEEVDSLDVQDMIILKQTHIFNMQTTNLDHAKQTWLYKIFEASWQFAGGPIHDRPKNCL